MDWSFPEGRPIIVAIAGSNGAGRTTFYESHVRPAAPHYVNADVLAVELGMTAYAAADAAAVLRQELISRRESLVFGTVFSDPVGEKIDLLREAARAGYTVVLCFIGIADDTTSQGRVAMRVAQGGHDVPDDELVQRFPRTLRNLRAAMRELPHILVFDNGDLRRPFRRVATIHDGTVVSRSTSLPTWLEPLLPE